MSQQQALTLALLLFGGLLYWWKKQKQSHDEADISHQSILEAYTRDLTAEVSSLDPVVGREEEIERVLHILSRRTKNNPLLLGQPGVGKTAVVEGIAQKIAAGDVPKNIQGKRVLVLDLGGLIGGTKYRGEFEERMKRLTEEMSDAARSIILFVDEVHMVEQAKGAEGAINVSDILKPALARGDLQMIGATTWREYQHFLQPDDALNRRLQPVVIGEPSKAATLHILRGIKSVYETYHGVQYSEEALKAAVELSKKYIRDRYLPDKAIDVIDESGAKVAIESSRKARHAMGVVHAAGSKVGGNWKRLHQNEQKIREEIQHLRILESRLEDETELAEIRMRLEKLLSSYNQLQSKRLKSSKDGVPIVNVSDVRDVIKTWTGAVVPRSLIA